MFLVDITIVNGGYKPTTRGPHPVELQLWKRLGGWRVIVDHGLGLGCSEWFDSRSVFWLQNRLLHLSRIWQEVYNTAGSNSWRPPFGSTACAHCERTQKRGLWPLAWRLFGSMRSSQAMADKISCLKNGSCPVTSWSSFGLGCFWIIFWLVVTGTMDFYDFPWRNWEFHHPTWRTHIFQRGRYTTNQMIIYPII